MFAASPHELGIFVQLIGVTKEESFEGWAINRRAIETFLSTSRAVEPAPEPEPLADANGSRRCLFADEVCWRAAW